MKRGLSIAVGGGIFALYLGWRRQRSTEDDLDQRERALAGQLQVAAATEHDALERRITELYTKAADGSAPTRRPFAWLDCTRWSASPMATRPAIHNGEPDLRLSAHADLR